MEYFDVRTILSDRINKILTQKDEMLNDNDKMIKEVYQSICEDLENKIPKDIGEMLIKENNDPNYTILIHRSSRAGKEEFFNNGLVIAGGNDLEYTTSRYKNNLSLLISVASAYGYKSNDYNTARCVVMKIPNTALNYEKGKTKPILFQTDNAAEQSGGMAVVKNNICQTVLLPEYILGSVEFNKDNEITDFAHNPNYTEVHDYKNDGLVCPDETIYSYIKQHPKVKYDPIDISNTISNENSEYMRYGNSKIFNSKDAKEMAMEVGDRGRKISSITKIQNKMKESIKSLQEKFKDTFSKDKDRDEH